MKPGLVKTTSGALFVLRSFNSFGVILAAALHRFVGLHVDPIMLTASQECPRARSEILYSLTPDV